jgi:hypothetical protein
VRLKKGFNVNKQIIYVRLTLNRFFIALVTTSPGFSSFKALNIALSDTPMERAASLTEG